MERRIDIRRERDGYFILDTRLKIKYQLDENKCLIKQINDICDIINMGGERYDDTGNENRNES